MTIEPWSESILVGELQNDPQFTDDIAALLEEVEKRSDVSVVLNFAGVTFINSSNISKLLKLRKCLITNKRRLLLVGIETTVWSLFLMMGLDKVFEFVDSTSTALAALQLRDE